MNFCLVVLRINGVKGVFSLRGWYGQGKWLGNLWSVMSSLKGIWNIEWSVVYKRKDKVSKNASSGCMGVSLGKFIKVGVNVKEKLHKKAAK